MNLADDKVLALFYYIIAIIANIVSIFGIIGVVIAVISFVFSRKDIKNKNELSNMPDFFFTAPKKCDRFGSSYCYNEGPILPHSLIDCEGQKMIYWFNMMNCGRFAAENLKIMIVSQSEMENDILPNNKRWQYINYWGGMPSNVEAGDLREIYTPIGAINIKPKDRHIYVLLEYISSYSKNKYKRIYEWCISDEIKEGEYLSFNSSAIWNFTNKDFKKGDFNYKLYEKLRPKKYDENGKEIEDIDFKLKFIDEHNMLDESRTKIKKHLENLSFNRPVFLNTVYLNKTSIKRKLKILAELEKDKEYHTISEWLKNY